MMRIEVELPQDRAVALEGSKVQYWIGEGAPVFTGTLHQLAIEHPTVIDYLLAIKAIKVSK